MSTALETRNDSEVMEAVLIKGDLSKLTAQERADFYMATCRSIGLNPTTRPLEYITLNGKLTLYARRDAADQLRKIYGISIEIVSRTLDGDLFTVHVRAKDKTGRSDEDLGVVALGKLQGEARANATLKAITKAKRRATLSICGLGMLDETEIEDVPASAKARQIAQTEDDRITEEQRAELVKLLAAANREVEKFCNWQKIDSIADLPAGRFDAVKQKLETIIREAA